MADKLAETIATYNKSAQKLAQYFEELGARVEDIETAFKLRGISNPKVVEIGCADGRDGIEIMKRTTDYTGFDPARELIKLAKQRAPEGNFVVADARSYGFPKKTDIVFAFASLLHLDKEEVQKVINQVYAALNSGGIFYVSMKKADRYKSQIKRDAHGERLFYLYHPNDFLEMAGDRFSIQDFSKGFITQGNTKWFELALKKL